MQDLRLPYSPSSPAEGLSGGLVRVCVCVCMCVCTCVSTRRISKNKFFFNTVHSERRDGRLVHKTHAQRTRALLADLIEPRDTLLANDGAECMQSVGVERSRRSASGFLHCPKKTAAHERAGAAAMRTAHGWEGVTRHFDDGKPLTLKTNLNQVQWMEEERCTNPSDNPANKRPHGLRRRVRRTSRVDGGTTSTSMQPPQPRSAPIGRRERPVAVTRALRRSSQQEDAGPGRTVQRPSGDGKTASCLAPPAGSPAIGIWRRNCAKT